MTSIAGLLAEARKELQDSDSPALDAELLLCHVLGKPRSFLFTWPEQEVGELLAAQFHQLLVRRVSGEPVAHLLGRREFYGHEFLVSADTLIPRPDTELLVDVVLEKLPAEQPLRIADLGTGTGAIAISLALARPAWQLLAVDYIVAVLDLVERNVRRLRAANVMPIQSSWYSRLQGPFDAIVSNPPYIPQREAHLMPDQVLRFEPEQALFVSDDQPLVFYEKIARLGLMKLSGDGRAYVETNEYNAEEVVEIFRRAGYREVTLEQDMQGKDRMVRSSR